MKKSLLAFVGVLTLSSSALAQNYAAVSNSDRVSYVASRNQRGTTVPIPIADITRLCGDMDGCTVRMGMYDWDTTAVGRVASREFLLFYNPQNRNWRSFTPSPQAGLPDASGQDNNSVVENVNQSWTCYMTDGEYTNTTTAPTDSVVGFGLLTHTMYSADCWLTVID